MGIIVKPYTATAGATIVAAEENANNDTIYNEFNGNVDNDNIKAGAGIVDTKLSQISTAGKVSGAALTSLASVPAGAGYLPAANVTGVATAGVNSTITSLIGLSGDVYQASWQNYSAVASISGCSSYTMKNIFCKRIGRTVFVNFFVEGTSDSTAFQFNLPWTHTSTCNTYLCCTTGNNTSTNAIGWASIEAGATLIKLFPNRTTTAWTASNTKACSGNFMYEAKYDY